MFFLDQRIANLSPVTSIHRFELILINKLVFYNNRYSQSPNDRFDERRSTDRELTINRMFHDDNL